MQTVPVEPFSSVVKGSLMVYDQGERVDVRKERDGFPKVELEFGHVVGVTTGVSVDKVGVAPSSVSGGDV
jgi:hypothetical protein